ncbi:MAG TPA: ferritin-like domain-containing protein [Longimicrobium sp.]|nr:ferritin-like domain-containing protein [Longimicrobium sp.]
MARTERSGHTTTDHDFIRRWVEERGGWPARVAGTESGGDDAGLIRVDFPGYSGEGSLERIEWEEWFQKFDESDLAFLHRDMSHGGGDLDRFNKLVKRGEGDNDNESRTSRSRSSGASRSSSGSSSRGGSSKSSSGTSTTRSGGSKRATASRSSDTSSSRSGGSTSSGSKSGGSKTSGSKSGGSKTSGSKSGGSKSSGSKSGGSKSSGTKSSSRSSGSKSSGSKSSGTSSSRGGGSKSSGTSTRSSGSKSGGTSSSRGGGSKSGSKSSSRSGSGGGAKSTARRMVAAVRDMLPGGGNGSDGASEMRELLKHELGDLLFAEKVFLKATKTLAKEAQDPTIRGRVEEHVRETEGQIERLNQAFRAIGEKPKAEKCEAALGLQAEHDSFKSDEKPSKTLLSAFDLGSGLRVEHYEIAAYRTAIAVATAVGERECADILKENLQEELAMASFLEKSALGVLRTIARA